MQIQLNQQEIEEAVTDFVAKQGFDLTCKEVTVAFTAGRGSNGITADIDIQNVENPLNGNPQINTSTIPTFSIPRKGILRDVDQSNPILHSNSSNTPTDRELTENGSKPKQVSDSEQSIQDEEAAVSEQEFLDEEVVKPKSTPTTSLFS
jgi:hypothetical protein